MSGEKGTNDQPNYFKAEVKKIKVK